MKYCKPCRLLASAKEVHCRRCGKVVVELGTQVNNQRGDKGEPALAIEGEIAELSAIEQKNVRRARLLAGICVAVVIAIALTSYQVYVHSVLSYALLSDVEITQDDFASNRIQVSFNVIRPGKVAFDRSSGDHRTEKIDTFSEAGPVTLSWAWPSPEPIDFRVCYRSGFFKSTDKRLFDVHNGPQSIDIVFLIDRTRSMEPFIKALIRKCTDFADVVKREGHDVQLGFVSFGDSEINEPIDVFDLSQNVMDFKTRVGKLKLTGGGDEPESSVEALQRALKLRFRDKARPCFVHVTDASCHHQEKLPSVADRLKAESIITYVVSMEEHANVYARLCSNGGSFLSMKNADFDRILDNLAHSLISEIRYQG